MDEHLNIEAQDFSKIIFIDRDGTINESPPHTWVRRLDELKFLSLNFHLFRQISKLGFGFIVVTNQRGLSTGAIDLEDYKKINLSITQTFQKEQVNLISVLTCPHSRSCKKCRKPNPGMLTYAIEKYKVPLDKCWMIGDQETDYLCAKALNVPFKLVDNVSKNLNERFTTNQALEEILSYA
jgi:histidinol-phosphate phosphatase family protein